MKLPALSVAAVLASSALLLPTGCGGDDIKCGTAACGGDPVGTWNIEGACFNADTEPPDECPEAVITADFDISGTVSFLADDTYTIVGQTSSTVQLEVPGSCLPGITDCSQLEDEDTTCSGSPETQCSCTIASETMDDDQGTWMTSGDQISLDGGELADYCVDGDTMSIHVPSGDLGLEIVLSRQ